MGLFRLVALAALIPVASAIAPATPCAAGPAPAPGESCKEAWVALLGADGSASSIAIDEAGAIAFAAGTVGSFGAFDAVLRAVDVASGTTQWSVRIEEGNGGFSRVAVAGDLVLAAGHLDGDALVVAHAAKDGARAWIARVDAGADERAEGIIVGAGRAIVVASRGQDQGHAIAALDLATGGTLWVARDDDASPRTGSPVALSPDGAQIYVAATRGEWPASGWRVAARDAASGALAWQRDFPLARWSVASSVAADGARVYATGIVTGSADPLGAPFAASSPDFGAVALDAASGATQWIASYDGPSSSDTDESSVTGTVLAGDRLVLSGLSRTGTHPWAADALVMPQFAYAAVALDLASGTTEWVARWSARGQDSDNPWGLAASADGARVVLTGESWDSGSVGVAGNGEFPVSGYDVGTIEVDARSGRVTGVARWNGALAGSDIGHAVAVASGGRIVVGASTQEAYGWAGAIVAYDPERLGRSF